MIPARVISVFLLVILIGMMFGGGCLGSSVQDRAMGSGVPVQGVITSVTGEPGISGGKCTPVTITQSDGTPLTLPCRPKRIIVANSNAAEMMIAIGAQDTIVGVTQTTTNISYIMDKIPQAENVGNWDIPNVERIVALHPDVVIAYSSYKPKNIDKLTSANITIVYLDCYRLPTLASDARALGALTGKSEGAEVYARMVEGTISEVTGRVKKIPDGKYPRVYSESYTEYTVSGPGSGSDEQLTLAGGKNIASDISTASATINSEWVVSRRPEYIFKVISSDNQKPFPEIAQALTNRTGWDTIPAVKNDHVYLFDNNIEFGPRAYIGLVFVAQLLHPDEFQDLHPRTMLDEYAGQYVSGTNVTLMIYP